MDEQDTPNGNGQHALPHNELVLKLQLHPWHLHIGGTVQSDSVALAMLRQALGIYEARERFALAQDLAAQLKRAAADQALFKSISQKG
jgi:hypothetical protein